MFLGVLLIDLESTRDAADIALTLGTQGVRKPLRTSNLLEMSSLSQAKIEMQPDVKLILGGDGGQQTEIMVIHQIMTHASPAFDAMLKAGKYAEGITLNQDKFLELPLSDDDAEAMTVLCNILHLQPQKVATTSITPDLLGSIATLVDKYDFTRAVQPWAKVWFQQKHIQEELYRVDSLPVEILPKWVHICCHLGHSRHFEEFTSALTARMSLDDLAENSFASYFAKLPWRVQGE